MRPESSITHFRICNIYIQTLFYIESHEFETHGNNLPNLLLVVRMTRMPHAFVTIAPKRTH